MDLRLGDDKATCIGESAGTPLWELSSDALRRLAARYFDDQIDDNYYGKYYGHCPHPREVFVRERLDALAAVMGEDAFQALAAEKDTEWEQLCAKTDAKLRCPTCGHVRSPFDLEDPSPGPGPETGDDGDSPPETGHH
jgi:hypothetical protein